MNKKRLVAGTVAAFLLIGGGTVAFAYWTTGGTGTGQATTDTTLPVTVNQTPLVGAGYIGAAQALSGDFTNPNSGPVKITSLTASVAPFSVQPNAAKPACTQADFTITGTATIVGAGASNEIPAGANQGSWSGLSVTLVNAATNQDNCKGVTVTIDYVAS